MIKTKKRMAIKKKKRYVARVSLTVLCPSCSQPMPEKTYPRGSETMTCINRNCDLEGKKFKVPVMELTPYVHD